MTPFARIQRGRKAAFVSAFLCFWMSVLVGVALASRHGAVAPGGAADLFGLPEIVLLPPAALLFIGMAFAFCGCETFLRAVIALAVAMGGVVLGMGGLISRPVDFAAERVLKAVEAVRQRVEER